MPLASLDHVSILCSDVERSRKFYSNVLGMKDGDRPPFDFPGAWLYVGDRPVVHLIGDRNDGSKDQTGSFDHYAFDAKDLEGMRKRLKKSGVEYTERAVPGRPLHQVFLHDPDGVMVELNFRGET
jgi:catechol 2,3-dioxygenase-like lactoylglutathione lyase family enzyme